MLASYTITSSHKADHKCTITHSCLDDIAHRTSMTKRLAAFPRLFMIVRNYAIAVLYSSRVGRHIIHALHRTAFPLPGFTRT